MKTDQGQRGRRCLGRGAGALCLLLAPAGAALAHSFGRVYTLPVPFWLYAWGAAAALALSFIAAAWAISAPAGVAESRPGRGWTPPRGLRRTLLAAGRLLALALLLLCIATGLWGRNSPYGNFNMTFFWIVFALGMVYLAALVGDFYASVNPWRTLAAVPARLSRRYREGLLPYPRWLDAWPALLAYLVLVWFELFWRNTPLTLAWMLLAYTGWNLLGAGLFGIGPWFRHGELFGVLFRLVGLMAPLARTGGNAPGLKLQTPFSGLLSAPPARFALLLFILFMLSSTAFDGLRATVFWRRLFWVDIYNAFLVDALGRNPLAAAPRMVVLNRWWDTGWLLLSPLIYLAAYWLCCALMRLLARARQSTASLAAAFAPSLLPIALVYHASHYYTLLQTQGVKIVALASDPFGRGENWLGTAGWMQRTIVPDAGVVWHVQVALIVFGHVVSVVLAHKLALRLFPDRWRAVLSQLPMLALMMLFTVVGLWVLSQPQAAGAG